jgi:hypothetical protein
MIFKYDSLKYQNPLSHLCIYLVKRNSFAFRLRTRCTRKIASFFLLLLLCPSGAIGANYEYISESKSIIYSSLDAENYPYVNKTYKATGWNDGYTVRSFYIFMKGDKQRDSSNDLLGLILYHEAAPGIHFPVIGGPKEQIKNLNFFKSGYSLTSEVKTHTKSKLAIEYIRASKVMRNCIVFVAKGGQSGGMALSDGTSYFRGYYCNPTNVDLDEQSIDTFLLSIGFKNEGSPAPLSAQSKAPSKDPLPIKNKPASVDVEEELQKAKSLYEKGLITAEEFKDLKKKILKSF